MNPCRQHRVPEKSPRFHEWMRGAAARDAPATLRRWLHDHDPAWAQPLTDRRAGRRVAKRRCAEVGGRAGRRRFVQPPENWPDPRVQGSAGTAAGRQRFRSIGIFEDGARARLTVLASAPE